MKYRANPVVVDAFKIVAYDQVQSDGSLHLELEDGSKFTATKEMMSRMLPEPGDYLVTQSDGYVYLNPKDVFERKYSLIGKPNDRPTIDELDRILNSEEEKNIVINPDGSISAV
jgi:hypothetical protein